MERTVDFLSALEIFLSTQMPGNKANLSTFLLKLQLLKNSRESE